MNWLVARSPEALARFDAWECVSASSALHAARMSRLAPLDGRLTVREPNGAVVEVEIGEVKPETEGML